MSRGPVLTIRNLWDLNKFLQAIRPINLSTALLSTFSVDDLLKLCGCHTDQRLRHFLELQIKLYSQEPLERTAALYGATVLQMAQAPLGLWHINGSMQKLSDALATCILENGGEVLLRHCVKRLTQCRDSDSWMVEVIDSYQNVLELDAKDIVCSLPPQSLLTLLSSESGLLNNYCRRLQQLPQPNGALVFYGAIKRTDLPGNCSGHLQLAEQDPGPLFLSISEEGDGRAPLGCATVIASVFTNIDQWNNLSSVEYKASKIIILDKILVALNKWLQIDSSQWLHKELATPKSFAKWTRRPGGIVGGLGQHPLKFGPFGVASRTPMKGLWLCGDSIPPGEGTAGVSQSALTVCKQILASRGKDLII